jgi:hypothetical protein
LVLRRSIRYGCEVLGRKRILEKLFSFGGEGRGGCHALVRLVD